MSQTVRYVGYSRSATCITVMSGQSSPITREDYQASSHMHWTGNTPAWPELSWQLLCSVLRRKSSFPKQMKLQSVIKLSINDHARLGSRDFEHCTGYHSRE